MGVDGTSCRGHLVYTIEEDGHSRGGRPSVVVGGVAVARGTTGDSEATRGATGVGVAARGIAGDAWAT
jgi:hypothetical protein